MEVLQKWNMASTFGRSRGDWEEEYMQEQELGNKLCDVNDNIYDRIVKFRIDAKMDSDHF